MKFICAQPAIQYYAWQVEVMINNFIRNGVSPDDIHIVCAYYGQIPDDWTKLKEGYKEVNFFFYSDTRKTPSYISSIRPHLLYKHWLANPHLENEIIFYHDCDIVFTKAVDFNGLLEGDTCYLSDTVSYIGANYIKSKGDHYLDLMTKIVNVDKNKVILEESNSGGAQYLIKKISADFWNKVYYDCETMYRLVNDQIAKDKEINPSIHEIQIWCADMWAVLWNLWFFNKDVRVDSRLDFAWSTSGLSEWDRCLIYHNAGVTESGKGFFYKAEFINKFPYDITLEGIYPHFSTYKYAEEILKTKEVTCLM